MVAKPTQPSLFENPQSMMRSTHSFSISVCLSVCVSHSAGELESAEEEESTLVVALLIDTVKCIGPCLDLVFCVCGEVFVMDL